MSAFAAIITIDLFIHQAHSLKEKRHTLKSILEKIRSNTNSSTAETDYHDLWQRAQITVALVQNERQFLEKQIDVIRRILDNYSEMQVNDFFIDYL